ncbi:CHAT domain-containing protein [Nemania sp. FL0031]|nr:CHAT domain-containing protein [Nemania sp. FL0031]
MNTQAPPRLKSGEEQDAKELAQLALKAYERFQTTGNWYDIQTAVVLAKESTRLEYYDDFLGRDAGNSLQKYRLHILVVILNALYGLTGKISDLEEAIRVNKKITESTPDNYSHQALWLTSLGHLLWSMYERTNEIAFLDEATEVAKRACELAQNSNDHTMRADSLCNLGQMFLSLYKRTGEIAHLRKAITTNREAIRLASMPNDDPTLLPACVVNLGLMIFNMYKRTRDITVLEAAIECARQAIELMPGNPHSQARRFDGLGYMLAARYERTGEIANLEEAIRVTKQSVELAPDFHVNWSNFSNHLGNLLYSRYNRIGDIASLSEAIQATRRAAEAAHDDHSRANSFNNLGIQLQSMYGRTGRITEAKNAIEFHKKALQLTLNNHPNLLGHLTNLGNALEKQYEQTGELADLVEAIKLTEKAVQITQDNNHHYQPECLHSLGTRFWTLYSKTDETADLEKAIKAVRQAIEFMSDNSRPDLVCKLSHDLGQALAVRHERSNKLADLEEAYSRIYGAWCCQAAVPSSRVISANRYLDLFTLQYKINTGMEVGKPARYLDLVTVQSKIDTGIEVGKAALDLLPVVNAKLLNRVDQYFTIANFFGIAANLCALLLERNQPEDAIEHLEKGRATIIGQLVDARSDLTSLRNIFNTPVDRLKQDLERTQVADRRRQALIEINICIQEIRAVEGHGRFLLGQRVTEMQECAIGGTIIIVNITKIRSDAILAWLNEKWRGPEVRRSEKPQRNKKYLEYLAWLWDVCVKTILDEIDNIDSTASDLPWIWWIGTGLGSLMPFHAAGVHSLGSMENTFSRAISSYTPSIKALGYAQKRARNTEGARGSLLIVTMPTTPTQAPQPHSFKDLPSVAEEADRISKLAEKDPSDSGLILQKRGEGQEKVQDRLTVQHVSQLNLAHAQIAFLSACSTAANKIEPLSDEAIHIVSGFQVAGFPHVIGSLWPSTDRVCMNVASEFYGNLFQRRPTGWTGYEVAWAVHEAVMRARRADIGMPLEWAQFVHFGA